MIRHGSRVDVVERFKLLPGYQLVYHDPFHEDGVFELYRRWRNPTPADTHLVFVCPPAEFAPMAATAPAPNRHLVFEGKVPAKWLAWARKHEIEVVEHSPTKNQLVNLLVAGNEKAGIPRFTLQAAEFLVTNFPGGLHALAPIATVFSSVSLREPISLEDVKKQWPVEAEVGYAADAVTLLRGTKASLDEALKADDNSFYQLNGYVRKACANRPEVVQCMCHVYDLVQSKRLTPKAGIFAFAMLVYLSKQQEKDRTWPSPYGNDSSFLPHQMALFQLSSIPSLENP